MTGRLNEFSIYSSMYWKSYAMYNKETSRKKIKGTWNKMSCAQE